MSDWESYLKNNSEKFVSELIEFVNIPSVSADLSYKEDVRKAGMWVANRLKAAGAENVKVMETGGHPVVYGDWLHAGPEKPTIMIYGHFDVQPADPFELWDSDPFDAKIKDDIIYGRGASDDKGGMLIPILSFEALLTSNGSLPVNVKFFFEGQEEIGSPQLPEFVAKHKSLLTCDMLFSADGLQWAADEAMMVMGLKGLVGIEIELKGPKGDQHSGLHGGAIQNPIMALSHLIASMKNTEGRITVDGFYDDVLELLDDEKEEIAAVPYHEENYKKELGVSELFGEPGYTTRERLWARPTLDLNGIWGGYQREGSKTVHPSKAHAKITCRLVANQDPDKIFDCLKSHVLNNLSPGITAEVKRLPGSGDPFLIPRGHNASKVAKDILAEVYGKEPYITRLGGTIPVSAIFLKELGVHTTMFGFSIGDENLHAPNEFFRLKNFRRGLRAYCLLLERLGRV